MGHERMQALIDQLQSKIKSYKKQIEEAEEIAALNLAKFRNAHAQLADAEKGLISMSKLWLSPRLRLVERLLELCKKMLLRSCRQIPGDMKEDLFFSIEDPNFSSMLPRIMISNKNE